MFQLTPQLLEMGLEKLGIAAAQLKAINPAVKKALLKLFVQAMASGDASAFLEKRLRWIDEYEEPAEVTRSAPSSRATKATARVVDRGVVEGELVDPDRPRRGPRR